MWFPNDDGERDGRDDLALELSLRPSTSYHEENSVVQQPQSHPPSPPQEQQPLLPLQPLFPQTAPEMHIQHFTSPYLYLPAGPNPSVPGNSNSSSRPTKGSRQNGSSRPIRGRQNSNQASGKRKSNTIPPPFPWATDRRATVHSLSYLHSKQIFTISGEVQCRRCERQYKIEYDLTTKFLDVANFIVEKRDVLHDRAPDKWTNPALPTCKFCGQENSAKPIIAEKKKSINWLFLLLGQMLGCCTLEQLKYFCKHTNNHRTGAKDRVLYLTYLALCKQLDPDGPFKR